MCDIPWSGQSKHCGKYGKILLICNIVANMAVLTEGLSPVSVLILCQFIQQMNFNTPAEQHSHKESHSISS